MDRTERTDGLGRVLYDGMMDGIASESAVVLSISFPLVLLPPCPLFSSFFEGLFVVRLPTTCLSRLLDLSSRTEKKGGRTGTLTWPPNPKRESEVGKWVVSG